MSRRKNIHEIFHNDESDKTRLDMFWGLKLLENDSKTFWKYRTGEFYPVTMSSFNTLKSKDAFYFIGGCYTCLKTCTGIVFGK